MLLADELFALNVMLLWVTSHSLYDKHWMMKAFPSLTRKPIASSKLAQETC